MPVTSIVLTTLIVSNARQNKTSNELNSLNLNGTPYQFTGDFLKMLRLTSTIKYILSDVLDSG